MKVNEESEEAGLNLNIQKTKIMASGPITSCQIDGEKSATRLNIVTLFNLYAYLTYMQSTSWEMLGWMSTSLNQDCREKYQ